MANGIKMRKIATITPESIDIPRATQLAAPLLAAAAIAKQEAQTVMFMNNS
jgi:hypothetical protein